MTKHWKKITAEKKITFFWGSKTTIYLSLGLHKERSSYRRSLQLLKEAIQHLYFPDSESGSGSTDPIESGSNPDPDTDPQPCFFLILPSWNRIPIQQLKLMRIHADPDPQHNHPPGK
jgi:hypothetical protein